MKQVKGPQIQIKWPAAWVRRRSRLTQPGGGQRDPGRGIPAFASPTSLFAGVWQGCGGLQMSENLDVILTTLPPFRHNCPFILLRLFFMPYAISLLGLNCPPSLYEIINILSLPSAAAASLLGARSILPVLSTGACFILPDAGGNCASSGTVGTCL